MSDRQAFRLDNGKFIFRIGVQYVKLGLLCDDTFQVFDKTRQRSARLTSQECCWFVASVCDAVPCYRDLVAAAAKMDVKIILTGACSL